MKQNKISKYLLYAIGEIILVVIGILIALQINNNNETKKARAFEHVMLDQIKEELILDSTYFSSVINRPQQANKTSDRLIKMKQNNRFIEDSIGILFRNLGTRFNYSYHKGAYESLKSVGLDKISNDSLRNHIASVYDFVLPRYRDLIIPYQEESHTYYRKTRDLFFTYDFSELGRPVPKLNVSPEILFNESQFINTLRACKSSTYNSVSRLNGVLKNISRLIRVIDKELKEKNNKSIVYD